MRRIAVKEKSIVVRVLLLLLLSAYGCSAQGSAPPARIPDLAPHAIIQRILTGGPGPETVVEGEVVYSLLLVRNFYRARDYQPAWSRNGRLIQAETLLRAVEEAYGDGLTPGYYHLSRIKALVTAIGREASPSPARLANIDILLSDAFITLGCHLSGGCVDPVTIKAEWFAKRTRVDVASVLEQALRKRQVRMALARLRPVEAAYDNLRQALAKYREMSLREVWPQVPAGPLLRKGDASERVEALRKRLAASGEPEVTADKTPARLFDEPLETALIAFQRRHGLRPDGIVGPGTLAALNVPLAERVRQIELNLERLRWILGNTERRFIIVNIADFKLDVIEDGKSVLSMKVVVGKPFQKTPVFTAKMTYLVINPVWNVPDSIARKEILAKVRKNPLYLAEEHMRILRGWGAHEEEIDPETVDWSRVSATSLPYRFRQDPGPLNPLGSIKFMFPNSFDIYLHDTPAKGLFSENVRTFSHGCTRIEKPFELAAYLLEDTPDWSPEKLEAVIDEGKETKVRIAHPLNVYFVYLTAWVDEHYTLQFRNDIYDRDKVLDEVLREKPAFQ